MNFRYDSQTEEDLEELEAWGYIIKRYTPYHIRIVEPEMRFEIDVWPTKRKLWDKHDRVRSQKYRRLFPHAKELMDRHRTEQFRRENLTEIMCG